MPSKSLLLAATSLAVLASPALALATDEASTDVSQVVVTAAPYPISLDSVTTSVNVVTRQQLDLAPPVGLGDLLNGLPGLRSSFYGPGASRPIIRGLSGPRVLILQNGVGLVDASTLSPDHAVASEPSEASRIEVLRGPSALAYGGSGIGGVINIFDDRIPSTAPVNGVEGRIGGSYDSVNDGKAGSAAFKVGKGPLVFAADYSRRKSEDYKVGQNPVSDRLAQEDGLTPSSDRKVLNTGVEMEAYGAGVSYVGQDGYIGVSVKRTDTTYGVPFAQVEGPADPGDEGPVEIHLQQTRYDLRGEKAIDAGIFDKVRFSVGHADYEHAEVGVESGEVGTRFLSRGTEGRVELVQREQNGWQGAFGVQGLTRRFEAIGDEAFLPPTKIKSAGIFTLQRLDKDAWGIEGGLRLDRSKLTAALDGRSTSDTAASYGLDWATATASRSFTNVSGSAAVFVRPQSWSFYALSLSHNQRAPTEFELFADGPHAGTGSYEIGNPDLKSEKVTSLEGTARFTSDRGRLEAHAYYAKYNGYIEERPTGDEEDGLPVFQFTQTDATFYGGEIAGSYDVATLGAGQVTLDGAWDYVHGKINSGAAARIPPYSVTAGLGWADERFSVHGEVRYVAKQDRVPDFELPTDSYTAVNLSASFKPIADKDFKLFVDGRNLTDAEIREHTSFLKDIAPSPGRSIRVGFAYGF